MKRVVLDTSVLLANDVTFLPYSVAVSVVSVAELQYGVYIAKSEQVRQERLRRLLQITRSFNALPIDEAVADSYGLLASVVAKSGRTLRSRKFDVLIAATAHAHNAELLTRNLADFTGLEDYLTVTGV